MQRAGRESISPSCRDRRGVLPRPDEAVAITVLFVLLVESAPSYAQSQARAYADPGTIDGGPVVVVPNRKRPPARPAR